MSADDVLADLIERFPALADPIEHERRTWREDQRENLHLLWDVIYHVVFLPMMTDDPPDEGSLASFFGWVEDSLWTGDKKVINWIDTGILERFGDELTWVARARPFMGELTVQHHRMVQSWWGRDDGFSDLGPRGRDPFTGFHTHPSRPPTRPGR